MEYREYPTLYPIYPIPYTRYNIDPGLGCREARTRLSKRRWRVDTLDALEAKWFSAQGSDQDGAHGPPLQTMTALRPVL